MLRVLHVITDLGIGGAEKNLVRLALADRDGQHFVCTLRGRGALSAELQMKGIQVVAIGLSKSPLSWWRIIFLHREIRRIRPDVVQTWMIHADVIGGIVARLAGAKKVFWGVRTGNYPLQITKFTTLLFVFAGSILSWVVPTKIISCSNYAVGTHKALGFQGSKFVVIPNGFPSVPLGLQSRRHFPSEAMGRTINLGCVARYHPQKDHRTLLGALVIVREIYPDVVLHLVGPGMTTENLALAALIREIGVGDGVRLLGKTNDVRSFFSKIDFHVLASRGGEAFPNVIAEAMANGVPCVSTDVGDARGIIGETGWVVPHSSPSELASAISRALQSSSSAYEARSSQAVNRIREVYPVERMVSSFLREFNR